MTTIDDRLNAAASEIKEFADGVPLPVPGADVVRSERYRMPAWAIAGVAATLVLLFVGVPILLMGGGDSIVAVQETTVAATATAVPPTTVAPITTTTAPTLTTAVPTVGMARLDFAPIPNASDLHAAWMSSVTKSGTGYVAGGGLIVPPDGTATPAIWLSENAVNWRKVESSAFAERNDPANSNDIYIADVAAGPLGIVAVGAEGELRYGDYDAAIWTSPNGLQWTRVPHDEESLGGDDWQKLHRVEAGGPGWIAVGQDGQTTGIWTSVDGQHWVRVTAESLAPDGGSIYITDLTVSPDRIVAVGVTPAFESLSEIDGIGGVGIQPWNAWMFAGMDWIEPATGYQAFTPVVWTSTDGESWERILIDEPGAIVETVTVTDDGTLRALGTTYRGQDQHRVVWRSDDGRTWHSTQASFRVPDSEEFEILVFEPHLPSLTTMGIALIVVGECYEFGPCVFGSRDDGATWDLVGYERMIADGGEGVSPETGFWPAQYNGRDMTDALGSESRVIVVGGIPTSDGHTARVWLGTPTD